jgi:hypothetical protein
MANFTITIGANTVTKTISAADASRLLAAYTARHAPWVDAEGVPFTPTTAQVFAKFTDGLFRGIKANVLRYEKEAAKAAVGEDIPDLPIT